MKKLWALALATALSVACIGCGNQTESKKNTRESIDVQTDSDATQSDTSEPVVASDLWQDSSVAKKVDELGLKSIVQIEGSKGDIAKTVRDNTKSKDQQILTLDSLQSVTKKDVDGGLTYLGEMEKNLGVIKDALK